MPNHGPKTFATLALTGALLCAVTLCAVTRPAAAQDEERVAARERALEIESKLVSSLDRVRRASVSVLVKQTPRDEDGNATGEPRLVGCGSGVLLRRQGRIWVLTNHHVAGEADALSVVTADGVERVVELHDSVERFDIALLSFAEKPEGVETVPLRARASEELEPGQFVIATGNPFFLALDGAPVATLGVVSGKDRVLGSRFKYGRAIQHDAAVNPGNSGGPLWNLAGDLVGLNGMIVTRTASAAGTSNSGASFSIPIDQIDAHLARLLDAGTDAAAGFLGIRYETFKDEDGSAQGAQVNWVHGESPIRSARKGFFRGCIIRSITARGKTYAVRAADDLTNVLALCPAGTTVKIKYRWSTKDTLYVWSGKLATEPAPAERK